MSITLEIVAGLVPTSAVVTIFTLLAAFELGRLVTRDEDQREVEITVDDPRDSGVRPSEAWRPRETIGCE